MEPWFYQGPYVPSGVIYISGGQLCEWLVPGFHDDSWKIDVYEPVSLPHQASTPHE